MKVYRAVEQQYSNIEDFCNGKGAKLYGGRWNYPGIPAIYCSVDIETSIAEKAYWVYTSKIMAIGKIKSLKNKDEQDLRCIKFKLLEVEVPKQTFVDLTDREFIEEETQKLFKNSFTPQDSIRSAYPLFPNRWTQNLGSKIIKSNSSIKSFSARKCNGINYILNIRNNNIKNVKILNIYDVKLNPIDSIGKIWKSRQLNIDPYKINFDIKALSLSKQISIMNSK